MSKTEKEIMADIKQTIDTNKDNSKQATTKPQKTKSKFLLPIIIVLVIAIIVVIVLLLTNSSKTFSVYVVDEQDLALSGANVKISYKDIENTQATDSFGYIEFKDIKASKVTINVTKESYNPTTKEIKLKNNLEETITLTIDTTKAEFKGSSQEKRREIIFKSYDVVVTDPLNVSFKCTVSGKEPNPKNQAVTNGRITVTQPSNCGYLLVSVSSNLYEIITDRNVNENNVVELTRANTNKGMLEVIVKDVTGQAIPYVNLRLHNIDNLQTPINESDQTYLTGITDVYGKYKFNAAQASYLVSLDKIGYINMSRLGPYVLVNNNLTTAEITLFTISDLDNINCSDSKYAPFCKNGVLDCNSSLLIGLVTPNTNGTGCILGRMANLTIKLKDQNTSVPVIGNISIFKRDQNTSTLVTTRTDVNQTTFILPANRNYRIVVSNTEEAGYLSPDPRDVNNLSDNNTTIEIPLEYSSTLNSGRINVQVSKDGYNRANALVYLFYEHDDEYILYNPETPKLTDLRGDANFENIRSNREYYAYSILRNENADGDSLPIQDLDYNETLELNIELNNQSKTLNLKITPTQDYNYSFFDVTGDQIDSRDIISTRVTGDTNQTFVFNCGDECSRVYLKIEKDDIIYQTDLINLFSGQIVYKELTFPTNLSTAQTATTYLGLFDETGTTKINTIGFTGNNDLTKEYKLKFKTVFGLNNSESLKKATIRAGRYFTEADDYIYLTNNNLFTPEDTEINTGCKYRGDLSDWNNSYFNTHYTFDHSSTGCTAGKYKWAEFDFTNADLDVIEYSINIKFRNEISSIDNYKIYYKSLNSNDQTAALSPTLSNWQNWSIMPAGFFYAPSLEQQLPFDNTNHSYVIKLYDINGELTKFGSDYILYIDRDYNYTLDFIQFRDNNRTGDIITNTQNANDNLVFTKSYFKAKGDVNANVITLDNTPSVIISNKTTSRGYYFKNSLIAHPVDFFSITGQPSIKTQLFKNSSSTLETTSTNVLSYSPNQYIPFVRSTATDGKIYIGSNDINISLKNRTGNFENDILVRYIISGQTVPTQIGEITNNTINTYLFIPDTDSGKTITFTFTIPNSNLPNNELTYSQVIGSGIEIYDLDNQLITNNNRLNYSVVLASISGKISSSEASNNYNIKNRITRAVTIEEISVSDNSGLLIEAIDQNIIINNEIPKELEAENIIFAKLFIDSNTNQSDINFNFNNIFTIQNTEENPITLYKDTNASVLIKRLNITDDSEFTTIEGNGYYKDSNGSGIEIIKDVSNNVSVNYNLDLTFNTPMDYKIQELSLSGEDVSNYINFTETHTDSNISNRLDNNISFMFSLKNVNVTDIIEKNTIIKIKIGNTIDYFIYDIPLKLIIYPKNKTYDLTAGLGGDYYNILCRGQADCNATKTYNLINKTKSYDLNLTGIEIANSAPLIITPQNITIPSAITQEPTELAITIDGNYTNLINSGIEFQDYSKALSFNLSINYTAILVNKNLTIYVTYTPQDPGVVLEENGLTGNFCMGVGGDISVEDYFILGTCDSTDQEVCKSGEEALPNIIYKWKNENFDWKTLCIDKNEEYDTNKTHCDSVQALYSLFSLIGGGASDFDPQDQNYYIYLMSDGFSDDLLLDFRERYDQMLTHNINSAFSESYLDQDYEHEITLSKVTSDETPTNAVGKYKIIATGYDNFANNLTITLQLVSTIPIGKDSLFYYIPIDGDFGKLDSNKVHRIGYGSTISNDYDYSEEISLTSGAQAIKLYQPTTCPGEDCSGITNLTAYYPTSNLVNWQVEDILKSNGVLLDLQTVNTTGTGKTHITFNFTPSKPIHLFAKVSDIDNKDFKYKFLLNETIAVPLGESDGISTIKWKDFDDNNYDNAIADSRIYDAYSNYLRHEITKQQFIEKYNNSPLANKYLLETLLYLPVNPEQNDIKLSLLNLDNNESSKIYGLNYTTGTQEMELNSRVSNIYSINDLFNQVKDGNACISKSLSTSKIRWVTDKIDLPNGIKNAIITNYNND